MIEYKYVRVKKEGTPLQVIRVDSSRSEVRTDEITGEWGTVDLDQLEVRRAPLLVELVIAFQR